MVRKKRVRGPSKRRELVVEDILAGATRLLDQVGGDLPALTLGDLARSLGFATSALYRYFDSKEALVVALQRRALLAFAADLERALGAHAERADPKRERAARALEMIAVAGGSYAALPERAPSSFRLIALSLADPTASIADQLASPVGMAVKLLLQRVEALIEEGVRAGALAPGEPGRGAVLFAAIHGALLLDKLARLELPELARAVLVPRVLSSVLVGFGAQRRSAGLAVKKAEQSLAQTFAGRAREEER